VTKNKLDDKDLSVIPSAAGGWTNSPSESSHRLNILFAYQQAAELDKPDFVTETITTNEAVNNR
jgi:hypothetical protein